MMKKNGEERSLSTTTMSSADESLPKVNPVKWTVMRFLRCFPLKKISENIQCLQCEQNCEQLCIFHAGG